MDLLNDLNDMKFDPYECFERNGCTIYGTYRVADQLSSPTQLSALFVINVFFLVFAAWTDDVIAC